MKCGTDNDPFVSGAVASMDENDRNDDPARATDGTPRRRPWLLCLWAGLTLAALAGLMVFFFRDELFCRWRTENDRNNRFPPGVLADYVPADSEAVLALQVRSLLASPVGRRQLAPVLQYLIRQGGSRLRWMDLLDINPIEDIDYLKVSFAAAGGEPLWLARGRLDRARIQIGPDKLQEKVLDRFHVWEYSDRRAKRTTLLALVGDMLVGSESRNRLQAALKYASNPRPLPVRDATLRELLAKVDRRQSLWLAASLKNLGSLDGIEDYWLRSILRPPLAHAEGVYGGLTCAEDVQVELHFRAATAEHAAMLETDLQSICDAAPGAAFLLGRRKELQPLLRLLGSGTITREEKRVHLHCRLAADQTEPRP